MSQPTMRPVAGSTAIIEEGYDPHTKTLYLQFSRANSVTEVPNVEPETYRAFLAAPSKGRFFHAVLK